MFVWQVLYGNLQKALESFDGTLRDPLMRSCYTPQRHGQAGRGICDIETAAVAIFRYVHTNRRVDKKEIGTERERICSLRIKVLFSVGNV